MRLFQTGRRLAELSALIESLLQDWLGQPAVRTAVMLWLNRYGHICHDFDTQKILQEFEVVRQFIAENQHDMAKTSELTCGS
jgi:hypothetical protein